MHTYEGLCGHSDCKASPYKGQTGKIQVQENVPSAQNFTSSELK